MSKLFKVGDICIGQNFVTNVSRNGMEGVVIGGLAVRTARNRVDHVVRTKVGYLIKWTDGVVGHVGPHNIRPKKPPRHRLNEMVSWETVGWMPFEVKFDRAIKQSLRDQLREKA
jgi:hypothetical protein